MDHGYRVGGALSVALLGAAAFSLLTKSVASQRTAYFDGRVRARFPKRRRRITRQVASGIGPIGKPWGHGSAALAAALYMHRKRGLVPAATILACSTLGMIASRAFEVTLRHRQPPPGRHSPSEPSFPSGHSLETAATSGILAYVLSREQLADPRFATAAALCIPGLSGLGRIYLDRHWATDVGGGWLAGLTLAAVCAAMYEHARKREAKSRR
ncbi:MAG: phosphatase PAP2 family protein [Gemmatimonadaceae bacterium]